MNVVCYGDSNTYGYDPRSYFGDRYASHCRWVDILSEKSGWNIRNEAMNGRRIPRNVVSFPEGVDLIILMLGTNDLLQGDTAEAVSKQMERFLLGLEIDLRKFLLIPPPPLELGEWVPNQQLILESSSLIEYYCALADQLGVRCLDTRNWGIPMAYDGVHFTEEGHKMFANHLWEELCT